MLSTALLLSAYLGICQEKMYSAYGKHSREAMFYVVSTFYLKFASFFDKNIYLACFNSAWIRTIRIRHCQTRQNFL